MNAKIGLVGDVVNIHALCAARNGGKFDINSTVEFFNKLSENISDAKKISRYEIELALLGYENSIDESTVTNIIDTVLLILNRKHPDLAAEDLKEITFQDFLNVLCVYYMQNPNIAKRFTKPA